MRPFGAAGRQVLGVLEGEVFYYPIVCYVCGTVMWRRGAIVTCGNAWHESEQARMDREMERREEKEK
ncbi:MAG: hypothetical protein Q7O66_07920 [Dehalococcoidia bacterium]|nr:hypothetical protein [Dehalococcoidia bacterium]